MCPREESNLDCKLRKLASYPLNDEGVFITLLNIAVTYYFDKLLLKRLSRGISVSPHTSLAFPLHFLCHSPSPVLSFRNIQSLKLGRGNDRGGVNSYESVDLIIIELAHLDEIRGTPMDIGATKKFAEWVSSLKPQVFRYNISQRHSHLFFVQVL